MGLTALSSEDFVWFGFDLGYGFMGSRDPNP